MGNEIVKTRGTLSRRTALAVGAGSTLAVGLAAAPAVAAPAPAPAVGRRGAALGATDPAVAAQLRVYEKEHGALLGVVGHNFRTGATVTHNATRRFPICSVFKTLGVAAVLRDLDRNGEVLARRIRYTYDDVLAAGGPDSSRITALEKNVAGGMTIRELCDASITHSDNCAANLLLRQIGGPTAITDFCRSVDDDVTRLDRWEPDLNTAEPGRVTDTTTPKAIAVTYARLVLGTELSRPDRRLLTDWLLANTTSGERLRAGLPADWKLGDKTGGGEYGTNNDVGIAWTPEGAPVVLAVFSTKPDSPEGPRDNALIKKTGALLAGVLR
ncbi:class A beta-lactamase [Streptomyces sp. NPDC017979]|uniref:class A beta-lactamase n=1 Tax=Streptomyces sp. NPDC017979 TaxID=3365024 RepID=UPI0037BACB4D